MTAEDVTAGSDLERQEEPAFSLVEVEPGIAVVFADAPPADIDLIPFEMMSIDSRTDLADELSIASGLGNFAIQGAQGVMAAQGLVRLAPETTHALNTLQPMTSGGWNLGSLVGTNGKIAASVRWAPAYGAQSVSMLAALGPAAALLALQLQLASISRRLDENIELTRDVLRALHEDQWATLLGLHETTIRAVREAQAIGVVNDHIFAAIATREADLRKQRHLFSTLVRGHVKALDTDTKGKRSYLQKNIEQILADSHGLLMAEGSWYRSQVLRAGHISRDHANAAENERLLAGLVEETERDHTEAMDEVTDLLGGLERQLRLFAELPPERSVPFTTKRQEVRTTLVMAEALAERVAALRNRAHAEPARLDPQLVVFNDAVPDDVLGILRWVLPANLPLLAIADVNVDRLVDNNAYLGVTTDRVFISGQSAIRKQGILDRDFPLADIRYVRFSEREKQSPVLDIITKDENIKLTFDAWSVSGEGLEGARRLANLLTAAMRLPDDERRTDPLLDAVEHPGDPKVIAPSLAR